MGGIELILHGLRHTLADDKHKQVAALYGINVEIEQRLWGCWFSLESPRSCDGRGVFNGEPYRFTLPDQIFGGSIHD